jgi:hypothetical protein
MALTAQSVSINHARSELRRKRRENPTRVATDELQLQERVRAEACSVSGSTQLFVQTVDSWGAEKRSLKARTGARTTYSLAGTEEGDSSDASTSSRSSESWDRSQQGDREERAHPRVAALRC